VQRDVLVVGHCLNRVKSGRLLDENERLPRTRGIPVADQRVSVGGCEVLREKIGLNRPSVGELGHGPNFGIIRNDDVGIE